MGSEVIAPWRWANRQREESARIVWPRIAPLGGSVAR